METRKPDKGMALFMMLLNMAVWGIPASVMYFGADSIGDKTALRIIFILVPILFFIQLYGLYMIFSEREIFLHNLKGFLIHSPSLFVLFSILVIAEMSI